MGVLAGSGAYNPLQAHNRIIRQSLFNPVKLAVRATVSSKFCRVILVKVPRDCVWRGLSAICVPS